MTNHNSQYFSAKSPWSRAPRPFPTLVPLDAPLNGQDASNHALEAPAVEAPAVEARNEHANDHGQLNHSSLRILRVDEMQEPLAWYTGTKFYVITVGTAVGIITDWGLAKSHLNGVPDNTHKGHKNWASAIEYYAQNLRRGNVRIVPMHHVNRPTRAIAAPASPIYVSSTAPTPVRSAAPAAPVQRQVATPPTYIYVPSTTTTPDNRSARTTPRAPTPPPAFVRPANWPDFDNPPGWPDLGQRAAWSLPSGMAPQSPPPNAPYPLYWITPHGTVGAGHNAPSFGTPTPGARPDTLPARILVPDTPGQDAALETPAPAGRGPVSLFPPTPRQHCIIVIDDSESDSDVEATEPRPIERAPADEYELTDTDDEVGVPRLRHTFDATTNSPVVDVYVVSENEDGVPFLRKSFDARTGAHIARPPRSIPHARRYRILTPWPISPAARYRIDTSAPAASGSGSRTPRPEAARGASPVKPSASASASHGAALPVEPSAPASSSRKAPTKVLSARAAGKARKM